MSKVFVSLLHIVARRPLCKCYVAETQAKGWLVLVWLQELVVYLQLQEHLSEIQQFHSDIKDKENIFGFCVGKNRRQVSCNASQSSPEIPFFQDFLGLRESLISLRELVLPLK